jgi:dUTP pyrophosphatase
MPHKLKLKKIGPGAKLPVRVTPGSAGIDLYAARKKVIPTSCTMLVDTDWAIEIPAGYVGLIKVNSGIAVQDNITENAGIVDCDYRGPLKVAIANVSDRPFKIYKGDRIGQLILLPYWKGDVEEVKELSETDRGEKGFGQASNSN